MLSTRGIPVSWARATILDLSGMSLGAKTGSRLDQYFAGHSLLAQLSGRWRFGYLDASIQQVSVDGGS